VPSQNEVALLRDQITDEVNGDAKVIGHQLFADNPREPDLHRMTDEQLRAAYRQKYLDQDRAWLQAEARRDPQQFVKVARQIGVVLPEELPAQLPPPSTLPMGQAPPQAPQAPPAPAGPAGPVDPQLALQALQAALAGGPGAAPAAAPVGLPAGAPLLPPTGPQPVVQTGPPVVPMQP